MRWMIVVVGLALGLALTAGCKQQCFMTECDYLNYHEMGLPERLECDYKSAAEPGALSVTTPPSTVVHPERAIRYISLAECIAIALEHGTVNGAQPQGPGAFPSLNDNPPSFGGGRPNSGAITTDQIRVLALDPAITGADIERSLSKFDARWVTAMTWQFQDQPTGGTNTQFVNLTQQGRNVQNAITSQTADFTTTLLKPLPTGGTAGITFTTDYSFTNSPLNRLNPTYTPTLQFAFEQPLLQGFGVEINQLRTTHPGATFQGLNFGAPPSASSSELGLPEGILITRLRYDENRAEFERNVQQLVLNVEQAYWTLYGDYWDLYSREQALRQAYEAWKINYARFQAGRVSIADFAQTRGQYEMFRGDRIESMGRLLEAERTLRGFLGLPMDDCKRLVPCDTPTLAPYHPDWCTAQNEALTLRPELVIAREELKLRQLDLINIKNALMPDLRFTSAYGLTGIGTGLDGAAQDNALRSLADNHYTQWTLGLRLDVPLGFRDAHASVRIGRLNLARSYLVLRDSEYRVQRGLVRAYRLIFERYEVIAARRSEREAYAEQLRARFQEFLAGRGTLDVLLEAQRFWATALASEYAAVVDYNNALALFEFDKGTILQHDNIYITEGPVPGCAQVRAVAHQEERTKALVLLERALPVPHQDHGNSEGHMSMPELPAGTAPSLPALMQGAPKGEVPETLPVPKPAEGTGTQGSKMEPSVPTTPAGAAQPMSSSPSPSVSMTPPASSSLTSLPDRNPARMDSLPGTMGNGNPPTGQAPSDDANLGVLPAPTSGERRGLLPPSDR